jgi:hypothetical protein
VNAQALFEVPIPSRVGRAKRQPAPLSAVRRSTIKQGLLVGRRSGP